MTKAKKDETTVTISHPASGRSVTLTPEKMARLGKRLKAVQTHLPGMEPVTIPEIEEAAEAFAEAKKDCADATEIAKQREADLISKMQKHEIRVYHQHGILVVIDTTDKAKVKQDQRKTERDERRNPAAEDKDMPLSVTLAKGR